MQDSATYSPEDNKLRLYPASRLAPEAYARVKAAGFHWAPKQGLFVAPMWTPEREDLLIELCGEVGDEDTSLVSRAEARAERFEDYSEARAEDASRARDAVSAITHNIPMGQPILIGHHSERHARKDAEKIENGMRRAVKMWEQSQYWQSRAAGAIHAAKYKELPSVRARRIKGLESDLRKQEKYRDEAAMWLHLWTECANEPDADLQMGAAVRLAGMCYFHLPRKDGDRPDFNQQPTADVALGNLYPNLYAPRTLAEVLAVALDTYPRRVARAERWIGHYQNRLAYERAMLAESGGTEADKTKPEKGGGCRCWASPRGGWSYIQKANKVSVTVLDSWGPGRPTFTRTIPFDKLQGIMSAAAVAQARADGVLIEAADGTGYALRETPTPEPEAPEQPTVTPEPDNTSADIDAMRQTLRAGGVEVVTANQLFPTPPEVARQMVQTAEQMGGSIAGLRVLEPSAGTGNLIRAAIGAATGFDCLRVVAVEINPSLCAGLRTMREKSAYANGDSFEIRQADFLECNGDLGRFDVVLMNPPFENGSDIKHIRHALTMLKPGGRLVAICANGPRQNEQLKPLASSWEVLPPNTFAGTGVSAVMLAIPAQRSE